jgi:Zn-dependent protease
VLFFADPLALAGILVAALVGLTFHEFTHAFVAEQLGDNRPRAMGRVSLNPGRHIDPVGAVFFLLVGFGWARPVLVNPYALRPGRFGMAMVAAGGPIANLLVAVVFAVLHRLVEMAAPELSLVQALIWWTVLFNVVLAVFNLLPIPPLDGYNVVLPFLPPRQALLVQRYAPYGMLVLLGLVLLTYVGGPNPISWIIFEVALPLARALTGAAFPGA